LVTFIYKTNIFIKDYYYLGGEVASFYFKRENFEKAEIKLLGILEIYENDGWECLGKK